MRITQTTLRRIIKEELDAVMNEADAFQAAKDEEERAATAAGFAAFRGSPERAMMAIEDHVEDMLRNELFMEWYLDDIDFRKLERMSNNDPQEFMKLIAAQLDELAPGRGVASDVFDDFDLQAELSEARPAGNAPRHKYIGKSVKKDGKSGTVVAKDKTGVLSIQFKDGTQVRTRADSPELEFLK